MVAQRRAKKSSGAGALVSHCKPEPRPIKRIRQSLAKPSVSVWHSAQANSDNAPVVKRGSPSLLLHQRPNFLSDCLTDQVLARALDPLNCFAAALALPTANGAGCSSMFLGVPDSTPCEQVMLFGSAMGALSEVASSGQVTEQPMR